MTEEDSSFLSVADLTHPEAMMIHVDDGCVDAVSSDHDDLMVSRLQFPYYTLRISLPITIEDQEADEYSDFSISCRGIGRDDESTDDDDDDDDGDDDNDDDDDDDDENSKLDAWMADMI